MEPTQALIAARPLDFAGNEELVGLSGREPVKEDLDCALRTLHIQLVVGLPCEPFDASFHRSSVQLVERTFKEFSREPLNALHPAPCILKDLFCEPPPALSPSGPNESDSTPTTAASRCPTVEQGRIAVPFVQFVGVGL